MDNLIFCLNATVPIFAIILLGRLLRGRNFFSKQTLAEIDKLSFKVLLPILLFRDIAAGRITEQFNAKFFFFSAGVTARQMVFSVLPVSATTRFVFSGSSPRSTHSTEA